MNKNKIIHILRNPWGWSDDTISKARNDAADLLEQSIIGPFPVIEETHVKGMISVEEKIVSALDIDFGIKISPDGRIWICIDGKSFLRFKPKFP